MALHSHTCASCNKTWSHELSDEDIKTRETMAAMHRCECGKYQFFSADEARGLGMNVGQQRAVNELMGKLIKGEDLPNPAHWLQSVPDEDQPKLIELVGEIFVATAPPEKREKIKLLVALGTLLVHVTAKIEAEQAAQKEREATVGKPSAGLH